MVEKKGGKRRCSWTQGKPKKTKGKKNLGKCTRREGRRVIRYGKDGERTTLFRVIKEGGNAGKRGGDKPGKKKVVAIWTFKLDLVKGNQRTESTHPSIVLTTKKSKKRARCYTELGEDEQKGKKDY